ncbi:MAG: FG-GAP-like repeat-containing protein [Melioribacteraceae bacterium]|nr:FG-GAP-like repeat-containing protein [Melioribacteraceae bacterium]MCF8356195.1 FG-GAP-like repeat-containing protein [Melioribacteraceae bacterium]MCF8394693.1 FG-GAP-like repeat-containing protein [Melioribacteraceae bacterium]MCF8420229.1 FG-GAP-like repeat-containing protein [Melioribacteraceae bacterium]
MNIIHKILFLSMFLLVGTLFSQSISFERHDENLSLSTAWVVEVNDINGDGMQDILGTSSGKTIKIWYGDNNFGFDPLVLSSGENTARGARIFDLNKDGMQDIISANFNNNTIKYWLNDGENFTEYILDTNFIEAHTIDPIDFDLDGDIDILGSAFNTSEGADKICWWENEGDMNFTRHVISTEFKSATFLQGVDMDDDGDLDIIASSETLGEIAWWENNGEFEFTKNFVDDGFSQSHTVFARDLDLDGDMDVVGCAYYTGQHAYWLNDGAQNFTKTIIANNEHPLWIDAADLDNDGDIDIYSTSGDGSYWFENDGSLNFTQTRLEGDYINGYGITAADIDADGDLDLLGAARTSGFIAIWKNSYNKFDFTTSQLTGHVPLEIQFTDQSTGHFEAVDWEWDFNNDGTIDSHEQNPAFTFNDPGEYTIMLRVITSDTSKTVVKKNLIQVFNGESSLLFSESSGYVLLDSGSVVNLSGNITFEFDAKPTTPGLDLYGSTILDKEAIKISLLGKGFGSIPDQGVMLNLVDSEGTAFRFASGDSLFNIGEWQHFAITINQDNGDVKLFYNGNEKPFTMAGSTPYDGTISDNAGIPLIIGKDKNLSRGFNGAIDEIRLWNYVRSDDDIWFNANKVLAGNETGLTIYYNMNEGTGNVLNDITGDYNAQIIDASYTFGVELDEITGVEENEEEIVAENFVLYQNYPNPFNPTTTIEFNIPNSVGDENFRPLHMVKLKVFDILGCEIKTLINKQMQPGRYKITFDAAGLSSGIYFYQLKADNFVQTNKMILLR